MQDINNIQEKMASDETAFVDAASSNPDSVTRAGIPDEVDDPSTIQPQTIEVTVGAPTGLMEDTYDAWFVSYPYLCTANNPTTANYYARTQEDFYNNTAISSLPVGGIQIYLMAPGTSPFPSSSPSIVGPTAPLQTVSLLFDNTILKNNMRVIGQNMEIKYTGADITAQGSITQCTVPSRGCLTQQAANATGVVSSASSDRWLANKFQPFPGDTATMRKYPGAKSRKIKEGSLQATIMNVSDNKPHYPTTIAQCHRSDLIPYGASAFFDLILKSASATNGVLTPQPPIYNTHSDCVMAVATGVIAAGTFLVSTSITIESFPGPSDVNVSYAHPSPLCDFQLLENYINAARTTERNLAARANALGNYARAFKSAFGKFKRVGQAVAPLALTAGRMIAPVQTAMLEKAINSSQVQKLTGALSQLNLERSKAEKKVAQLNKSMKAISNNNNQPVKKGKKKKTSQ